jgi:hypothetical protein
VASKPISAFISLETGHHAFFRRDRLERIVVNVRYLRPAGEMLLGDARRLLQLEEAARHRLAAPRLSGTVRLGVVEEVAVARYCRRSVVSPRCIRA